MRIPTSTAIRHPTDALKFAAMKGQRYILVAAFLLSLAGCVCGVRIPRRLLPTPVLAARRGMDGCSLAPAQSSKRDSRVSQAVANRPPPCARCAYPIGVGDVCTECGTRIVRVESESIASTRDTMARQRMHGGRHGALAADSQGVTSCPRCASRVFAPATARSPAAARCRCRCPCALNRRRKRRSMTPGTRPLIGPPSQFPATARRTADQPGLSDRRGQALLP